MNAMMYSILIVMVWLGAGMIGNILLTLSARRLAGTRVSHCPDIMVLLGPFSLAIGICVVLYVLGSELLDWTRKRRDG